MHGTMSLKKVYYDLFILMEKYYILRIYVTLYIVRYTYVFKSHLTVWAEELIKFTFI